MYLGMLSEVEVNVEKLVSAANATVSVTERQCEYFSTLWLWATIDCGFVL